MATVNPIGSRSKNTCRWKKKSSKVVEAEMCNKVEARHLVLITKILDREKAHNAFNVEKAKRAVKGAMQAMKDTSGKSELGEAPSGPDDSDYRDSPFFLNGVGVISEKRLQKWRAMADQMARELKVDADGGLLEPPWQTNPYENIEQSFHQLLDGLGYEEEAALVKYLKTRECRPFVTPLRRKSYAAAPGVRTRCDVFACLRNDGASGDRLPGDGASQEKAFCVQQWERAASEEYIAAVTRQLSSGTEWPKSSAPSAIWSTNSKSDVRHLVKDSDMADIVPRGEDSTYDSFWTAALTYGRGDRKVTPTSTRNDVKHRSACLRHLATTPCRTAGATELSIDTRPILPTAAPIVGTNADSNDRRIGATHASERTAIDGSRAYAQNNSRISQKKPGERTQNTAKLDNGRPCTAPHCARIRDEGDTRYSRSATTWRGRNKGSISGQAGNITGSGHRVTNRKHDCTRCGIKTNANYCTQTTATTTTTTTTTAATTTATSTSELDVHCVQSVAVSKATTSDASNWVSETIAEVATPSTSDDGSSHRRKSSSSPPSSSSSSFSSSPRDIIAPKADIAPTVWKQNPRASLSPRQKPQSDRPNPGSPRPNYESHSPSLDSILRAPDIRRLPQWKRDLMLEAPPGLFSSREPVKVSVVMSKSQRQRELDQLVEENLSDVRTLVMRERARKMRARMNVFITMGTIQHAVKALKKAACRE